jgi:hypothetical protein
MNIQSVKNKVHKFDTVVTKRIGILKYSFFSEKHNSYETTVDTVSLNDFFRTATQIILYMLRQVGQRAPPLLFPSFSPLTVTFPKLSVILRPL